MKTLLRYLVLLLILPILAGCTATNQPDIAATTLPVYDFTQRICQGSGLTVDRLVTENVSCLHEYSLRVSQMRSIEAADVIVLSGAGLEEFLDDALTGTESVIDASAGVSLICPEAEHGHDEHGHHHEQDPHIWLSPLAAKQMACNICEALCLHYPAHAALFRSNLSILNDDLDALQRYGEEVCSALTCRELITFHDGFAYFAQAFGLEILQSVEEESGSEASAQQLIGLIREVQAHDLPAIFIEANGSTSAAGIIAAETGADIYVLDMAMSGDSYFDAMYNNLDTLKEALG